MTRGTSPIIGANLDRQTADAEFALGTRMNGVDGTEWVYCKDSGSGITQYFWVGVDENFSAGALTTAMADDGYMIGAAQIAVTADYYFWLCVKGSNVSGFVSASCPVDQLLLYTGATAGHLYTAATGGSKVIGVTNVVSAGTAAAAVEFIIATNPHNH